MSFYAKTCLAILLALTAAPRAGVANGFRHLGTYGTQQDNQSVTPLKCYQTAGFFIPAGEGFSSMPRLYWFPVENGRMSRVVLPVPDGAHDFQATPGSFQVVNWRLSGIQYYIDFSTLIKRASDGRWQLTRLAALPVPPELGQPYLLAYSPTSKHAVVTSYAGEGSVFLLRQNKSPVVIGDRSVISRYHWTPHGILCLKWDHPGFADEASIELRRPRTGGILAATNRVVFAATVANGDVWFTSSNALSRLNLPGLDLGASIATPSGVYGVAPLGPKGVAFLVKKGDTFYMRIANRSGQILYKVPTVMQSGFKPSLNGRLVSDGRVTLDVKTGVQNLVESYQPYVDWDFLRARDGKTCWARANFYSDNVDMYLYDFAIP